MAKLEIIKVPSEILRKRSERITKISCEIKKLIADMRETMHHVGGLGISAPQVEKSLRLAIIESAGGKRKNGENLPKIPLTIIINPKIVCCSKEKETGQEGCLSVPEVWGNVERYKNIVVEAENEHGYKRKIKAGGLFARAMQHEIDHLDGIIFTDKVGYSTLHKLGKDGEKIPINLNEL